MPSKSHPKRPSSVESRKLRLVGQALVNFGASLKAQILFISNLFFWNDAGDYFAGPTEEKPLLHTWSLAVEEQFYILMPLLCMFIRWRWSAQPRLLSLRETSLQVFGWLLGLSFTTAALVTFTDTNTSFFWLHTRAWELLLGACLACLPAEKWNLQNKHRVNLSWIAILVILVIGWVYNKRTLFPGLAAAPPCLAAAFLIWAGHPRFEKTTVSRLLGAKPLVAVGLASYSFYLWHWPVLAFLNYLSSASNSSVPKTVRVTMMLIVFGISLVSVRWIEAPIRKRLWLSSRRSLMMAVAVLSVTLFGVGWAITNSHGFPQRIKSEVLNYAEVVANDKKGKPWINDIQEALDDRLPVLGDAFSDKPIQLLVWGDSHAKSIAPAITSLCEQHEVKGLLAAYGSTVPMLGGFNAGTPKGLSARTAEWGAAVVKIIQKRRIPNILIAAAWKAYSDKNAAAFQKSLLHTVTELKATGTQVWIMLDVPHLSFSAPNALAFHERFPELCPDPRQLALTLTDHEKANRVIREMLPKLKEAGIKIIDPSPYQFSSSGKGLIEENGQAIFGDSNHLTISGALRLKPLFEPIFKTQSLQ